MVPPTEEDARSSQMRILDALKEKGITASFTLPALQKLYPICDEADYNITVSLAWNGSIWQVVDLEAGDTAAATVLCLPRRANTTARLPMEPIF